MERKDMYTWIIIAVVAIVAIVLIYVQNAGAASGPIDVRFAMNSSGSVLSIYPYQSAFAPVQIHNFGTAYVKALEVGIFINGNLSSVYNVSIPAGQSLTLNFSKQFSNAGTFNISYVADPSDLYALQNRSQSRLQFQVQVQTAETAAPYSTLPANATWQKESYTTVGGYVYYSVFHSTYGLGSFQTSEMPDVNSFFNPLFNLTYSYIYDLYSGEAIYPDARAYSLWIQSALSPNVTNVWAQGAKLSSTNQTLAGRSIAVVTLDANTTLCSWYSGGWLKNLAYQGNETCVAALGGSLEQSAPAYGFLPRINDSQVLANFSEYSTVGPGSGLLQLVNSTPIYEASIPNTNPSYLCYGVITSQDNRSYCTTLLFPLNSNTIGPVSLVSTTSFIGQQNLSIISLVNTSAAPYEIQPDIDLLSEFNVSGTTQQFVEGINSSCSFNASLSCYAPSLLGDGNITMGLYNKLNETFEINTFACTQSGTSKFSVLNVTIPALSYLNVTAPCYDDGNVLTGVPLGLTFGIDMNYTVSEGHFKSAGEAYVV